MTMRRSSGIERSIRQGVGATAAILLGLSLVPRPANADEFDALLAFEETALINNAWEACAAAYVKPRLQSRETSARLAEKAMQSCRAEEGRLRRFLVGKIGRKSASNVIAAVREKHRVDLTTAINELRQSR